MRTGLGRWAVLAVVMMLGFAGAVSSAGAATVDADGLWMTDVVPPCIADGSTPLCAVYDGGSVELGVKFQTSMPINVVGVRFYRADAGTWSGSLWDAAGTRLTSGADSTTGAGWQEVMFAEPQPMAVGQTFIASYYAPAGAYAFEWDYFTSGGRTVGPVTALQSVDGNRNGVYSYSADSAFPTDSFRDTNYWVTPLWTPPYTLAGFYQPVDMGGVLNTVKGGSTVPLKFEIFWGATELTDISAVDRFEVAAHACPGTATLTDSIELVTTGGTSLRYDSTAGQFIQNWKTPKVPGACYTVTMYTVDGSSISAEFKMK